MDAEEQDHLSVRIKHRGACPYEKGHDRGDFPIGMFVGALLTWIVILVAAKAHS